MANATATKFKFSAHVGYMVYSPDPKYKGISAKQEFLNGSAQLRPLPEDATAEAVADRMRYLEWFDNSGYRIKAWDFGKPREEIDGHEL